MDFYKKGLLCLALLLTCYSAVYSMNGTLPGNGTENDPYLIEDELDFNTFIISNKYNEEGVFTSLTADISDQRISRYVAIDYMGVFNGNNHTIRNLDIYNLGLLSPENNVTGLFPKISPSGVVKNLILQDVYVKSNTYDVGGLCGRNWGTIENCHVTGYVYSNGYASVGLLLANNAYDRPNTPEIDGGIVKNCSARGIVEAGNDLYMFAGGLCGANEGLIENCYADTTVIGTRYVGGLCGWNSTFYGETPGKIVNCYVTGHVSGNEFVGGFVGYNEWPIENCYSTATVESTETNPGGFVEDYTSITTFSNCFWNKEIVENSNTPAGSELNILGLTTAEMQDINTFNNVGWDIAPKNGNTNESVWVIEDNGYPKFSWSQQREDATYLDTRSIEYTDSSPDSGMTESEAVTYLADAGIIADVIYDCSSKVPSGKVILCKSPQLLRNAEKLTIVVSIGPYNWNNNPGDGTKSNPYQISTPGMLFGLLQNKHFELINNIDLKYYQFSTCVIRSDFTSKPIFSGTFDGNGYTVSNISIRNYGGMSYDDEYFRYYITAGNINDIVPVGFFCVINGENAEVKNLNLENMNMHIFSQFVSPVAGFFVGVNDQGSHIYNCKATGYGEIGKHSDKNISISGFAGYGSNIDSCYSICQILNHSHMLDISSYLSGFAAYGDAISNCYAKGKITVGKTAKGGGFVGFPTNHDLVSNCYSNVSISTEDETRINGFVGFEYRNVLNCFWDVEASGVGIAGDNNSGAIGKTTFEMQDMATYIDAGWDFVGESANGQENKWRMSYVGAGYPILAWQKDIPGDIAGEYGVNIEDFGKLAQGWIEKYTIVDLEGIAANWLAGTSDN